MAEDWRSRATKIDEPNIAPEASDWKSRAIKVDHVQAPPPDQTSTGAAALQGFGQGGTLGYLPEIQAGFGAGIQKASEMLGGPEAESFSKLRDAFDKRNQRLATEHPYATAAGNVAGAVATLPTGGAMEGAGLLAKLGRAAGTGAAYGALMNPGGADLAQEPMDNIKERAQNALTGGVIGAAGEGLIGSLGKGLQKAGEKTSSAAVLKQMGTNAGQTKKILMKGEVPKLTEFMTSEGLMMPGQNTEKVMEHTGQILKEDGPKIGQIYKDAQDQAATIGMGQKNRINGNELADKILEDTKAKVKNHTKRDLIVQEMQSAVAPLRDMGENANIADVNDFRKSLDSEVSWNQTNRERDSLQKAYVDARNTVNDATKNSIESLDQALGGNQLDLLKKLNARYSAASTVNNISTQAQGRHLAKALMGHGIIGGGAGLIGGGAEYGRSHDPLKALGVGALSAMGATAARRFGAPVGYYGGKAVTGIGKLGTKITPTPGNLGVGLSAPWLLMNGGK